MSYAQMYLLLFILIFQTAWMLYRDSVQLSRLSDNSAIEDENRTIRLNNKTLHETIDVFRKENATQRAELRKQDTEIAETRKKSEMVIAAADRDCADMRCDLAAFKTDQKIKAGIIKELESKVESREKQIDRQAITIEELQRRISTQAKSINFYMNELEKRKGKKK